MRKFIPISLLAAAGLLLTGTSAEATVSPAPRYPAPVARPYVPPRYYPPPFPQPPVIRTVDHPPVDNVRSFDNGSRDGNRVAITFDADMTVGMFAQLQSGAVGSWYNREVIEILRQENVPATIFMTGLWARAYPEEARLLAADPLFEIGSHTYDHAAFRLPCYNLGGALNPAGEIVDAQATIAAITGITPRLLRFPGDCYNEADLAMAADRGLTVISGDVRSGDGFNSSPSAIVNTVERLARPGSIILMHLHGGPNAPNTAFALRQLIPWLRAQGLEPVAVSQLLGRERAQVPAPAPLVEVAPPVPSQLTRRAAQRDAEEGPSAMVVAQVADRLALTAVLAPAESSRQEPDLAARPCRGTPL